MNNHTKIQYLFERRAELEVFCIKYRTHYPNPAMRTEHTVLAKKAYLVKGKNMYSGNIDRGVPLQRVSKMRRYTCHLQIFSL